MLKIRRPLRRLIFNMGIAIPGKTIFLIETAPCISKILFYGHHPNKRIYYFLKTFLIPFFNLSLDFIIIKFSFDIRVEMYATTKQSLWKPSGSVQIWIVTVISLLVLNPLNNLKTDNKDNCAF